VGLIDIRNGAVAGDLLMPELKQEYTKCEALGFSADGARLWTVIGKFREYQLIGWNLADGSVVINRKLGSLTSIGMDDARTAEKVPDILDLPEVGGLLLHGRMLIDAKTGEVMWEYGNSGNNQLLPILRFVGKSQMLVTRGAYGHTRLTVVPIPFEEIKASRELIAAGGTARDMGLPPLTKPDWSKIDRGRPIATSKESYVPKLSTPAKLREKISIDIKTDADTRLTVQEIRFAGGSSKYCALLNAISAANASPGTDQMPKMQLAAYDLASGERITKLEMPAAVSLLDISADGGQAVIGTTDDGRIDVWDLRAGKHQLGFRPSGLKSNRTPLYQLSSSSFPTARIVADQKLLTEHTSGELTLWEMDGAKPVYCLKTRPASTVALDDSRTYVVTQDDEGARVCIVATGEAVATLPASQLPPDALMTAAVFRSDGSEVAMLFDNRITYRLIVWNLKDDKVQWDTPLPFVARTIAWSGADLLLGSLYPPNNSSAARLYRTSQRTPSTPNYERQYPDPNQLWPADKLRAIVRVSPAERRFVWLYQNGESSVRRGEPTVNYAGAPQLIGQTAPGRAWVTLTGPEAGRTFLSLGERTTEEAKSIKSRSRKRSKEIRGNQIDVAIDIKELPETIARAKARRAEFRDTLEESLKKMLTDYTLSTTSDRRLVLRATVKEAAARDLLAPDGKSPLFGNSGPPMGYTISPGGPNGMGVLARLELLRKSDKDARNEDPLWLSEAWFYSESRIQQKPDVQSELQLLVPWEKAVRWLGERTMPASIPDHTQFATNGTTELSFIEQASVHSHDTEITKKQ
jgi:hypothetical protein